jgi:hypothetical protein
MEIQKRGFHNQYKSSFIDSNQKLRAAYFHTGGPGILKTVFEACSPAQIGFDHAGST